MPRSLSTALAVTGFLASWCCPWAEARAAISFSVEITDAAALASTFMGPFALDFQFSDASGTGDANNTLTIGSFVFDGTAVNFAGAVLNPQGIPGTTLISASGDPITITDGLQGPNEVWLPFTPGSDPTHSSISFVVSMTTALDAGNAFDTFGLQILQQVDTSAITPAGIATQDSLGNDAAGILVSAGVDLTQGPLTSNFITPPSPGTPVPGVDVTLLGGSGVPEPATLGLVAIGLVGLIANGRRKARRL